MSQLYSFSLCCSLCCAHVHAILGSIYLTSLTPSDADDQKEYSLSLCRSLAEQYKAQTAITTRTPLTAGEEGGGCGDNDSDSDSGSISHSGSDTDSDDDEQDGTAPVSEGDVSQAYYLAGK